MAATRVHSPSSTPMPTASSPKAMVRPNSAAWSAVNDTTNPMGLDDAAASICCCTPFGEFGSR